MSDGTLAQPKIKKTAKVKDGPVGEPGTSTTGKSGSLAPAKKKPTPKVGGKDSPKKPGKAADKKGQGKEPSGKPEKSSTRKTPDRTSRPAPSTVSAEVRHQLVREAAYYRAERRGFHGGHPDEDWAAAEAEIDRMLLEKKTRKG
ncbi:MAG: DUF2934 domain-containing protein [Holophaga sp.]|nr:DUF2934 domain-containing protein [Holophaga sp.]